jgi:Rad3-related DNA helicase
LALSSQCQYLIEHEQCRYHQRSGMLADYLEQAQTQRAVLDLEDLATVGRQLQACPYYGVRERLTDGDLLLMPYNYLLDWRSRHVGADDGSDSWLSGAIVVLDEAHNVEAACLTDEQYGLRDRDWPIETMWPISTMSHTSPGKHVVGPKTMQSPVGI